MRESGWNRREFVSAAALVTLAFGLPAPAFALADADAPSERQRALLREVSEIVLPTTETPGGGATGTGDFVLLALAHGLDGARSPAATGEVTFALPEYRRSDGSLRYADWLEKTLDRASGGNWLGLDAARREEVLRALDKEAFANGADNHPWRKIKGLIVVGYYTSEVGGSQELQYKLVPGHWDGKVTLGPRPRAFSNDWTAVDFG